MIAGTVDVMAIERSELELVWPANLFAQEARALLAAGHTSEETLGFLLAEAFHADRGFRLFQQVQAASSRRFLDDPWDTPAPSPDQPPAGAVELVAGLVDSASELPRYVRPLYYSARLNPHPEPPLTLSQVKTAFCTVITSLAWTGYFDDAFGSTCTDARQDTGSEGQHRPQRPPDPAASVRPGPLGHGCRRRHPQTRPVPGPRLTPGRRLPRPAEPPGPVEPRTP